MSATTPMPMVGRQPDPRRWGLGDVAYGLLLFFGGQIGASVLLVLIGAIDVTTGEVDTLPVAAVFAAAAAGWVGLIGWPLYCTYRKGQKSLERDFGLSITWPDVGWGVLGGIGALVLGVVANVFWLLVSDSDPPSNSDFLPTDLNVVEVIALLLTVAVCTPIAEELFFRGLFLRAAAKRFNARIGVIASTVVFGSLHLQSFDLASLFIVVITGSYGLLFALLAVWRNSLGPAIVAHSVVNGVGVLAVVLSG